MNNDPINIAPGNNNSIDDQKLIDYVSDKLTIEEKLEVEKLIAGSDLVKDAIQGLKQFKNTQNLPASVDQLNSGLHKHLYRKKPRRQTFKLKSEQWIYVAVITILLLVIIGFIVIRMWLVR